MVKCPKCNGEIDYLKNWYSGEMETNLYPDGYYEKQGFIENGNVNDYECPECQETLFTDEENAIKFLMGK